MALAGPASNLLLALAAAALICAGRLAGRFEAPEALSLATVAVSPQAGLWTGLAMIVSMLFSLNLILVILNLIPRPPLDGSGAMPLLLSEEASRRYRSFTTQPMLAWVGLILAWNIFDPVFHPIFLLAVNLLYPGSHYGGA